MVVTQTPESVMPRLDPVVMDIDDQRVVRALQVAPRASFARLGSVLGLPERTVARRYRALRRDGFLRIFATVNPKVAGQHPWMVRVRCRPDSAEALAAALARRDDVRWLSLAAAGSELVFSMRSLSAEQRETLLTRRLPRTAHVLDIDAAVVLHIFIGDRSDDWDGLSGCVTAEEAAALTAISELPAARDVSAPVRLEPTDRAIIAALARDGRASYAELAAAAGITEGRITRRLATLLATNTVFIDMDLALRRFGYTAAAHVYLRVTPSVLHETGKTLAALPEVCFAAATSGPHNLVATVLCHDLAELYTFTTSRIGALDGVQTCEISPVLRNVKQAGGLADEDGRLLDPA
ncbi:Lrp/AsnC family transcriptional regulator [Pseudofrankia inefficax]|uniref:Transcriptional regulator, AsnC family n=1 Tax=Pseudofrankia inefficax (strain DSM 45817 / CECT 9037 / DDB 130130 / EuI1c) TaxID=298654 RepID=E3IYA1_PSEI1|nr:Lrp/AsnC family transcriptional regulator [Pseudofrankia inefficax]ADP82699.1 transcriptional regulator, AsnC family [Pseudofrankia inefficax]